VLDVAVLVPRRVYLAREAVKAPRDKGARLLQLDVLGERRLGEGAENASGASVEGEAQVGAQPDERVDYW
jgi:hypothetical protein